MAVRQALFHVVTPHNHHHRHSHFPLDTSYHQQSTTALSATFPAPTGSSLEATTARTTCLWTVEALLRSPHCYSYHHSPTPSQLTAQHTHDQLPHFRELHSRSSQLTLDTSPLLLFRTASAAHLMQHHLSQPQPTMQAQLVTASIACVLLTDPHYGFPNRSKVSTSLTGQTQLQLTPPNIHH